MTNKHVVICQKWEESERGWGTRPDGYSLHLNDSDRRGFIEEYWASMPNSAPDEYSRPDGTPYEAEVEAAVYEEVEASKNGIRRLGNPPGHGGVDGWISMA